MVHLPGHIIKMFTSARMHLASGEAEMLTAAARGWNFQAH